MMEIKVKNTLETLLQILFLLSALSLSAQPTRHPNLLTPAEGLPQSSNEFILRDSRGYVWISSLTGVTLYDGQQVRNIAPDPTNHCTILEGNVQSRFFEDDQHCVWFTTDQYLYQYQPTKDCFAVFQPRDATASGVRLIGLEQGRWLWGVSGNEVFYFDTHTATPQWVWTGAPLQSLRYVVDTLPNGQFSTILGCLWAYGPGVEVLEITPNRTVIAKGTQLATLNGNPLTVTNGCTAGPGDYWLSTRQGLVHWQKDAAVAYASSLGAGLMRGPPTLLNEQSLLVGMAGQLWHFDIPSKSFTAWALPEIAYNKAINVLYIDQQQNLWMGVEGCGILHCNLAYLHLFQHIPFPHDLGNPRSMTAHPPSQEPVVLFPGKGIWSYNGGTFQHWANTQGAYYICSDSSSLYFGNNKAIQALTPGIAPRELRSTGDFVYNIWKKKDGLFYSTSSDLVHLSADDYNKSDSITGHGFVHALVFDHKNSCVLVGNEEHLRLYEWNVNEQTFGSLLHDFQRMVKATNGILDTLHNCYWIGGRQNLLRIDRETYKVQTLGDITGNPDNFWVCAIEQDNTGVIWFSSHAGIYRFDPSAPDQGVRHFTLREGLGSNEYIDRMSMKTADGRLWFGSSQGIDVITPTNYLPENQAPILAFQDLLVMNQPYPDRERINTGQTIQLPYYENTLTFKFAALDYLNPDKNTYWVHLSGYDTDTSYLGTQREVTYVNLPPGEYTFSFTAANAAGVRNPVFMSRHIRIVPPFWKTGWFKLLMALLAVTLLFLSIRGYLNYRLREQRFAMEKQQLLLENELRMQTERNRIADELHDDLGGKLSTILFASRRMMRLDNLDNAQHLMEKVSNISLELIDAMRSIIWDMDTQNDNLHSLLASIRNYSARFGEDNDLEIQNLIPTEVPAIKLHGLIRHSILLCVKESLHNALKHAHARQVIVQIDLTAEALRATITDDGIGFDVQQSAGKGKGLQSLQKRMNKVGGDIKHGKASLEQVHVSSLTFLLYRQN
ncbi:MAG: triple tyrosine motif-containing protein [Saprospiraceae bacterium]